MKIKDVLLMGDIVEGLKSNRPITKREREQAEKRTARFIQSTYWDGMRIFLPAGVATDGSEFGYELTLKSGKWVKTKFVIDDRVYLLNPDGSLGKRIVSKFSPARTLYSRIWGCTHVGARPKKKK